jgi:hypothetical protein
VMVELANVIEDDGGVFAMGIGVFELAPSVDPAAC